jgi:hypothetical protein
MKWTYFLIPGFLFFASPANGQSKISGNTYKAVLKLADSVSIHNGDGKLYNLFKTQITVIYENQEKPKELFKKAIIQKTYLPFKNFWEGYVGDSNIYFDEVIVPLLKDSMPMIERKAALFANGKIDVYFKKMAAQMQSETGYFPKGRWYLAFGSGVTDLGGFGGGVMVLDCTHYKTSLEYTKFILPHELTHQIFDFTNKEDSSAKGLYRCINEGFAVLMNQKLIGNKYTLSDYLQYTENELNYCFQNEAVIYKKLKPFLLTNNAEHAQALANRGQKIFKDGPGAIGYFLGYRICQTYINKNGKNSWKDIYTMPVKEILEKSGYHPN